MKFLIFFAAIVVLSGCGHRENVEESVGSAEAENFYIRVLIGTSGFEGLVHEDVKITSGGNFFVQGCDEIRRFSAGEIFQASDWDCEFFNVLTENRRDKLEIIGLRRNWGGVYPKYRGVFEISRRSNGFTIVNELRLEEYLYSVVPSEMPAYHGIDAAKVQAVTARTYAVHQVQMNLFSEFGAHVDDSVISQVYNNIPENDISTKAVRMTRGRVLTYNGEIIIANFFSTSGGTTANFGEVWAVGDVFPSNTPEFLRARAQFFETEWFCANETSLRTEEAAAVFFRSTEIPGFDKNFPWFRWQVTMTTDELSQRINQNLVTRQAVNPALIQVNCCCCCDFQNGGHQTIGQLQHMEVTRRGQGGNIMEMIFYGTTATARVQTEFNIRALLNPGDIPVIRHDGSKSGRLTLMPSAFFTMELAHGNEALQAVTFFGGGHGHGVGMSQFGANTMANRGHPFDEILLWYYTNVTFAHMADIL